MELTKNGNPRLFTRTEVKASIMQAGYGQQEEGTRGQLLEDLGSDKYNDDIYDIFVMALEKIVPGFYSIMNWINELWNPNWEAVSWVMPDGHKVVCKPTSSEWVKFKPFNQFEVTGKIGGVEKEKKTLLLFVTIIHSVDAYIARRMLGVDYDLTTIHDDFVQLPNHANQSKINYREIMADINDNPLLENILEQITGQKIDAIQGDLKSEDILDSTYAIC